MNAYGAGVSETMVRHREHRVFAAVYDRMTAGAEAAGLARRRQDLLAGARGRVLEVGAGTGANLAHYPGDGQVSEVVVLEPDGAMRRRLAPKLPTCPAPVRVVAAGIEDAGLEDASLEAGSFDTVVCTLVLCTVPDLAGAARRLASLLRPDGRLLFLEHVAAPGARGRVQAALTPLWHHVVPGCHLDRDPVTALRRAGLVVTDYDRIDLPLGGLLRAGVTGTARLPTPVAG